ncbi:MAG: DUF4395 domain-containing protein [Candidatus Gracilibacteria bacterium]|jgi:hypothetical protein|nr:DUF4395 domain-containing protein [Candidatus Gracilibacteria bacterium]
MKKIIYFGETVKGYEIPVLNEREARAGAGILFVLAMISFMNAFFLQNFYFLKLFIITFLIEFAIRVLINPKFAPSLILGKIASRNQKPEYVGAPQKKFAWAIGLILALTMFILVVISDFRGIFNLIVCLTCLSFLFFETSFGICIGCKLYNMFHKNKAKLCPGGACEIKRVEEIQKVSLVQGLIVVLIMLIIAALHLSKIVY